MNSDVKRGVFIVYLLGAGLTNTQIGFIQTALFVAMMLGELPSGIIADKFGRKVALSYSFLLMILYGVGYLLFTDFIPFFVLFIIHGLAFSLKSGADQALLYDYLKETGKQHLFIKINSRSRAISALTVAASMAIGGWIKDVSSWNVLFSIYIASKVVGVLVCALLTERRLIKTETVHSGEKIGDDTGKATLVSFFTSPKGISMLPLFIGFSLYESVLTPTYNYGQSLLNNAGFSLSLIGLTYAAIEIANSGLYLLSGLISRTVNFTVLIATTYFLLAVSLYFLPSSGYLMLVVFCFTFCLPSFVDMIYLDYVNEHYPSEIRASCISVNGFISSLFIGSAYFIYGYGIEEFGIESIITYSSGLIALALPVTLYGLKRLKSPRTEINPGEIVS
nr:MFS transporter [Pantoea sp. 201603H]